MIEEYIKRALSQIIALPQFNFLTNKILNSFLLPKVIKKVLTDYLWRSDFPIKDLDKHIVKLKFDEKKSNINIRVKQYIEDDDKDDYLYICLINVIYKYDIELDKDSKIFNLKYFADFVRENIRNRLSPIDSINLKFSFSFLIDNKAEYINFRNMINCMNVSEGISVLFDIYLNNDDNSTITLCARSFYESFVKSYAKSLDNLSLAKLFAYIRYNIFTNSFLKEILEGDIVTMEELEKDDVFLIQPVVLKANYNSYFNINITKNGEIIRKVNLDEHLEDISKVFIEINNKIFSKNSTLEGEGEDRTYLFSDLDNPVNILSISDQYVGTTQLALDLDSSIENAEKNVERVKNAIKSSNQLYELKLIGNYTFGEEYYNKLVEKIAMNLSLKVDLYDCREERSDMIRKFMYNNTFYSF